MSSLELLAAPPGVGKTAYCIDVFRENVLEKGLDSRAFFVLPNREHADRIAHLVLKKELPGLFNAHILTFQDLTVKLFNLSGLHASGVSDAVRTGILSGILNDEKLVFPYFDALKDDQAFLQLLSDSIKEFESSLLTVPAFERAAQPLVKNAAFRQKFRDFTLALKHYHSVLERLDLQEMDRQIPALVKTKKAPQLDLVIFDGFYDFTKSQRTLLSWLSKIADRSIVTLTLPSDETRAKIFDYPWQTKSYLLKAGFKEKKLAAKNFRTNSSALLALEKNLFSAQCQPAPKPSGAIKILNAGTRRMEIEMIAREIRHIYRDNGLHFSDISLILRQISSYEPLLRQVFADYGIPLVVHEREKLIEESWVGALRRFLNLTVEGWRRDDVLSLLRTHFFSNGLTEKEAAVLEALIYARNIREGRANWENLCASGLLSEAARQAIESLLKQEAQLSGATGPREMVSNLIRLSKRVRGEEMASERPVRAFESACRGLAESAAFERNFEPKAFAQKIQRTLQSALFSAKTENRNAVQVYDAVMALPKEYKVVFIGGMLEGAFPKDALEEPLFKDAERKVLNRGETLFEERGRREAGEKYFFYMAVTRAKEKLVLSFPQNDSEGRPLLSSFFVEELKRCFESVEEIQKSSSDFLPEPTEWSTFKEVVEGFSDRRQFNLAWAQPVLSQAQAFAKREQTGLKSPAALEFLKAQDIFSPTRLEIYALCPFKYFSEKILSLNPPHENREHLEMGNLLHKVLDDFFKSLPEVQRRDPNFWSDQEKVSEALQKGLNQSWSDQIFQNQPLYRRRIFYESMMRTLQNFAIREAELCEKRDLIPTHFELEFGAPEKGGLPYLILEEPSGPIRFTGKIDRIDVDAEGHSALVIDYKKGDKDLQGKLDKGLELQTPLYMMAVEKLLGQKVMGAELRILGNSKEKGVYADWAREPLGFTARKTMLEADAFEEMLERTRVSVRSLVKRLRKGDVSVAPNSSQVCRLCDIAAVCRFEKAEREAS